jgi:hypothetical protein
MSLFRDGKEGSNQQHHGRKVRLFASNSGSEDWEYLLLGTDRTVADVIRLGRAILARRRISAETEWLSLVKEHV